MSEKDLTNYKTYISDLDITKYIVLDSESNYWYSAEYVDKMLKKQDNEIERLHSIIKEVREYIEKRKDTQKWRKESLKAKSTNIDIVLEHFRDILEMLDKENK